jgi:diguanylate cyclase (GGDEF)-like protein
MDQRAETRSRPHETGTAQLGQATETPLRPVQLALGVTIVVLAASTLAAMARGPFDAIVIVQALALVGLAIAVVAEQLVSRRLEEARTARDGGMTRILQRLSRSLSFDAVVQSIGEDLRQAADVDHVAVARVRTADGALEVTLVSSSPDGPMSRTILSADALEPAGVPAAGGRSLSSLRGGRRPEQLIADEIGRRVRNAYGLAQTLAAPLVVDEKVVGAIVLSRRAGTAWASSSSRLLTWAAEELSVALSRAYRYEAAETRANIDALTGLPNRRYLEELVAIAGPRRRAGDSIGVLMIDIDRFKQLNDRYGHATGDVVLRAVGDRISAAIRASDSPARYGGEEFAVLLRRATPPQALEVAERIRQLIRSVPPAELGIDEPISVSVGVAVSESEDVGLPTLLESADKALYRAKREGRNRVVLAR